LSHEADRGLLNAGCGTCHDLLHACRIGAVCATTGTDPTEARA